MRPTDSGGPLMPEQAAYDIKSYDLDLHINPADQSIMTCQVGSSLCLSKLGKTVVIDPQNWVLKAQ